VFNRVLRRIFGPKGKEVAGGCRGDHNRGLHKLHTPTNISGVIKSRRLTWANHVARIEAIIDLYKILIRKHETKRPLLRPKSIWGDNIRMYFGQIR
jgi:hypothetical protein